MLFEGTRLTSQHLPIVALPAVTQASKHIVAFGVISVERDQF
jgi:hypothetical protein